VGSFRAHGVHRHVSVDPILRRQTYHYLLTTPSIPGEGKRGRFALQGGHRVAAALPLTVSEKDELRWKSITGYNEPRRLPRRLATRNGVVQTGIDVLEPTLRRAERLHGQKKIGLLTNQTGIDSQGRRTIDVLAQAPGVSLDAIFSPSMAFTGELDTTDIANTKDAATRRSHLQRLRRQRSPAPALG